MSATVRSLPCWPVVLSLLLAAPAAADNTADEADVAFNLGNAAYAKKDYERALGSYLLSNRLVPNRNVLFNIARCFEALSRFDEAYRYYDELAAQELPDDDARQVKAALGRLAARVALLAITTEPAGADVYVDREDLGSRGKSPITLALAPGAHKVFARLPGHRSVEGKASVFKGREARLKLSLERILGKVAFEGSPAGASIQESADSPPLGAVPSTLALPPGQRLFVVSAKGFLPQQLLAEVKGDQTVTLKVSLQEQPKPTGKVVVVANREGATVRVDGREAGFTPTVLVLPEGPHQVEVRSKDLLPFSQEVTVKADAEARLEVDLRYAPPAVRAASKSLVAVDEAPASISVLTAEELRGFGYQTVVEAVQALRGVYVSNDRIYSYMGIRGFSPPGDFNTRVLILWDGHPINDVWVGQGYAARDLDVDLSEVERIEFVRGPGSALYGTGAFFAVINVVPREKLDEGKNLEAVGGVGGAGGGFKARGTASLDGKVGSAVLSAAYFNGTGAESTTLEGRGTAQGLDGERAVSASARARLGGFSLNARLNTRSKDVPTAPLGAVFGAPGTTYNDTRAFVEARYEKEWARATFSARISYDTSHFYGLYTFANPGGQGTFPSTSRGGGHWGGVELRTRIRLFGENFLSVGAEGLGALTYSQNDTSPADPRTRITLSGYLLDEWKVFSRLYVSAGLRVDKSLDIAVVPLSPRLGVVVRPYDAGITKLVVGQAFRAPNTYELYFSDGQVSQRAPTSLRPETITTFELEHSHDLTRELRLTAGAYYNLIDRLLVLTQENTPTPNCGQPVGTVDCLVYQNSAQQLSAFGAEGQVRWQPGRFTLVDLSYSYVRLLGPSAVLGDVVRGTPRHLVAGRVLLPLYDNFVRISGQVNYQSPRGEGRELADGEVAPKGAAAGEALLLNVGLSGEFKALRYFAGVQNLLDQRYALPLATETGFSVVPQYGRTFWMELAVRY